MRCFFATAPSWKETGPARLTCRRLRHGSQRSIGAEPSQQVEGVIEGRRVIEKTYALAQARYAELGVNTDQALEILRGIPVSLHCWQGDDVGGFENGRGLTGGGIQATGNYPGKARNADELG